MENRSQLLENVARIIVDYRKDEIPTCDAAHVDKWVRQFPDTVQAPILAETAHILERSYITRDMIIRYFHDTISKVECSSWKTVNFLNLQTAGGSQKELMRLFDAELKAKCGFSAEDCESQDGDFIYIDDAIFSGGRLSADIRGWIEGSMPQKAKLFVLVYAAHLYAEYSQKKYLHTFAQEHGKELTMEFLFKEAIENRLAYKSNSDILWPTNDILTSPEIKAYEGDFDKAFTYRTGQNIGKLGLFSNPQNRAMVENEYIKAGLKVLDRCRYLAEKPQMRPLGSNMFAGYGFGTLLVTYRNCPNNAPLVWWAGNPWYPLFPRKTN